MRVIKLMADYQCHPLWNMSPGEYGDVDPDRLPISLQLKKRLARWAQVFDSTLNMDNPVESGFGTEEEKAEFKREGFRLAEQLKVELGPEFEITVSM